MKLIDLVDIQFAANIARKIAAGGPGSGPRPGGGAIDYTQDQRPGHRDTGWQPAGTPSPAWASDGKAKTAGAASTTAEAATTAAHASNAPADHDTASAAHGNAHDKWGEVPGQYAGIKSAYHAQMSDYHGAKGSMAQSDNFNKALNKLGPRPNDFKPDASRYDQTKQWYPS